MEEYILENILMIKKMEKDYLNGLMVKNIMENGKMENNMDMENISMLLIKLGKKDIGNLEEEKNG